MSTEVALNQTEVINKVKTVITEMLEKSPEEIWEDLVSKGITANIPEKSPEEIWEGLVLKDIDANIPDIRTALEIEFTIGLESFDEDVTIGHIIWVILHTLHFGD